MFSLALFLLTWTRLLIIHHTMITKSLLYHFLHHIQNIIVTMDDITIPFAANLFVVSSFLANPHNPNPAESPFM